MNIKQIEFKFKGSRDYIQGTDMFNTLMGQFTSPTMTNIRFTIHDFIRTAMCQLYLTTTKESLKNIENIAANCQLDIDGITHWMAITHDSTKNHTGGYPYDEDRILSLCSIIEDRITLNNQISPHSFIETIVAMNKHMHQQLFPEISGKWIFTRIDLPVFYDTRKNLSLRLRHNMNYKLTKSDIEVDGNKVGDIFFSLVKK